MFHFVFNQSWEKERRGKLESLEGVRKIVSFRYIFFFKLKKIIRNVPRKKEEQKKNERKEEKKQKTKWRLLRN